jgi:hypothetical protein
MYEKLREELNISHDTGTSLGQNLDNEINTIELITKSTKILKLL